MKRPSYFMGKEIVLRKDRSEGGKRLSQCNFAKNSVSLRDQENDLPENQELITASPDLNFTHPKVQF